MRPTTTPTTPATTTLAIRPGAQPPARVSAAVRTLGPLFAPLLGALLGILAASVHYLVVPPQYSATALLVVVPRDPAAKRAQVDNLTQIRWSQALARIATDPQISGPELTRAGLPDVAARPQTAVSTSAAPDTAVFSITARMPQAGRARTAARAVTVAVANLCRSRDLPACAHPLGTIPIPTSAAPGLAVRVVLGLSVGVALGVIWLLIRQDRARLGEVGRDPLRQTS